MSEEKLDASTPGKATVSRITAVKNGDLTVLAQILNQRMASPNELLKDALFTGPAPVIQFLIEHGASIGPISDTSLRSALHEAVLRGRADVCRILVTYGADPGYAPPATKWRPTVDDNFRLTPFQLAVFKGQLEIAEYFVSQCGQDPNCRAVTGETLLQLARKHPEMKTLIRSLRTEGGVRGGVEAGRSCEAPGATTNRNGMSPL